MESYHDLITDQTGRNMKLEEAVEVIISLDTQLKELTDQKERPGAPAGRVKGFQGQGYTLCRA